jgi:hypothetical protein
MSGESTITGAIINMGIVEQTILTTQDIHHIRPMVLWVLRFGIFGRERETQIEYRYETVFRRNTTR